MKPVFKPLVLITVAVLNLLPLTLVRGLSKCTTEGKSPGQFTKCNFDELFGLINLERCHPGYDKAKEAVFLSSGDKCAEKGVTKINCYTACFFKATGILEEQKPKKGKGDQNRVAQKRDNDPKENSDHDDDKKRRHKAQGRKKGRGFFNETVDSEEDHIDDNFSNVVRSKRSPTLADDDEESSWVAQQRHQPYPNSNNQGQQISYENRERTNNRDNRFHNQGQTFNNRGGKFNEDQQFQGSNQRFNNEEQSVHSSKNRYEELRFEGSIRIFSDTGSKFDSDNNGVNYDDNIQPINSYSNQNERNFDRQYSPSYQNERNSDNQYSASYQNGMNFESQHSSQNQNGQNFDSQYSSSNQNGQNFDSQYSSSNQHEKYVENEYTSSVVAPANPSAKSKGRSMDTKSKNKNTTKKPSDKGRAMVSKKPIVDSKNKVNTKPHVNNKGRSMDTNSKNRSTTKKPSDKGRSVFSKKPIVESKTKVTAKPSVNYKNKTPKPEGRNLFGQDIPKDQTPIPTSTEGQNFVGIDDQETQEGRGFHGGKGKKDDERKRHQGGRKDIDNHGDKGKLVQGGRKSNENQVPNDTKRGKKPKRVDEDGDSQSDSDSGEDGQSSTGNQVEKPIRSKVNRERLSFWLKTLFPGKDGTKSAKLIKAGFIKCHRQYSAGLLPNDYFSEDCEPMQKLLNCFVDVLMC